MLNAQYSSNVVVVKGTWLNPLKYLQTSILHLTGMKFSDKLGALDTNLYPTMSIDFRRQGDISSSDSVNSHYVMLWL